MSERVLRFASFELRPTRGQLLNNGIPVALGSRAIAILTLLAERAGEVISVNEITSHVWPKLYVQENNLRVHVSAIRRALKSAPAGDVEIINVPGRGYRLHAEVTVQGHAGPDARTSSELRPAPIPLPISRLIGRDDCIVAVAESMYVHRLVTVVGAGGIGKTSVALAGLHALANESAACFVDLTNCSSVEHVATAVASALQSPMGSDPTPAVLVERLRDAELILLFDNCEHLIDVVAKVAETLLQSCAGLRLLATSREPLRVPGEVLLHLQALAVPSVADSVEVIADSPSATLFVERAVASTGAFTVTSDNARHVAAICRSLDGLPLALELAAAALPVIGIDDLSSGLTDRLSQVAFGRRTLARHETLDAMLDWSFELLSTRERNVLCSLGCFRSGFNLAAAVQVAVSNDNEADRTAEAVLQLAAKSLLVVEPAGCGVGYRLLETTKVYARRRLEALGQAEAAAQRHAEWVRTVLDRAQDDWLQLERTDWWDRYGTVIDDVRAALIWSLEGTGDKRLGVSLTLASAPLWIGLAQFAEYNRWLEQALATLKALGEEGGSEEIQLQIGFCVLLFNQDRPGERFVAAASEVLRIGEKIGDPMARATGLWLLAGYRQIVADHPGALKLARQMLDREESNADPDLRSFAQRVIALMSFRAGQVAEAAAIGAELLTDLADRTAYGAVLRYDHYTIARSNHALTLAVQGQLDDALRLIGDSVADSVRLRNPASFCYLLSSAACPIALWAGDDDLARSYAELLAREASENRFTYMGELATWYRRIVDLRTGQLSRQLVTEGLSPPLPHDMDVFITTCAACCNDEAVRRANAVAPHWATAEILRAHGEDRLADGDEPAARALFEKAWSLAEAQGSWLWALRAAKSLARISPPEEAQALLQSALERVVGGEQSSDVQSGRTLLREVAGQRS